VLSAKAEVQSLKFKVQSAECIVQRQQNFAPCFSLANNKQPNNPALAVNNNPEKSAQFGERFRNKSGMTATIKNGDENRFLERSLAIASLRGFMRGDVRQLTDRGVKKKNNTQCISLKNNTKYNILVQKDCFVPRNDGIYIRSKTKEKIYKNSFSLFFPNGGVKERELSIHLN